jgi:hypothetical protein
MTLATIVKRGVRNARSSRPAVDREEIERVLRCANRRLGRKLGRIEWFSSYGAYIGRTTKAIANRWTLDTEYPFAGPAEFHGCWREREVGEVGSLEHLYSAEEEIWAWELAAYAAAGERKRFPVDLTALEYLWRASLRAWSPVEEPWRASSLVWDALDAAVNVQELSSRQGSDEDARWEYEQALAVLPFLTEIASCFALGLFAAASLRRGDAVRTLLIERPRLRYVEGRLHADDEPAVVWPDGSARWYWDEVAVPSELAERRNELTADAVAAISNQEIRRVVLDRIGWDQFLNNADATLVNQDDYGKLWATGIELEGERAHLVEVVNASAEPDGSYRRYFLRVPPTVRTARAAVAWTFGFDKVADYAVAAQS